MLHDEIKQGCSNPYYPNITKDSCYDRWYYGPHSTSNSTACADAWIHAWKDWCTANTKQCVRDVVIGKFPDAIVNTPTMSLGTRRSSIARTLYALSAN
jgi:hypothetical protein